ncbi:MAG: glycoside hydrolase family 3 protein [Cellulomonas sp.]|nr:glycoside hydrolase family 3 protein [Cellulomonas sp.]
MQDAVTRPPADAPYRDARVPVGHRVDDLLERMTLEEKAGQLFHAMTEMGEGGTLPDAVGPSGALPPRELVARSITHVNVITTPESGEAFARWHNELQHLAAQTRLGIPVTVSSDPRHAFVDNPGTSLAAGSFSLWPEPLGLAALRDPDEVERFADCARQEYLAVGIRVALHPQVDLLTEPRWARGTGTFGEDVELASTLGEAYVHGFQATGRIARERQPGAPAAPGGVGRDSVSTMTKHFPGGGPQLDGEDPHFAYGREQVYPAGRFDEHLAPFRRLIAAGTRQIMPYYGMPVGLERDGDPVEQVGFGFSRQILTDLLRHELGFDGIICTDWGLVSDMTMFGARYPARAWGVEHLAPVDRVAKILDAGADQLGGETCVDLVVELVRCGRVDESRLDASVRRLLTEKFLLGLFDEARYVDPERAARVVGNDAFRRAGRRAQSRAVTALRRGTAPLPFSPTSRVYLETPSVPAGDVRAAQAALGGPESALRAVARPEDADVALLRLDTPFEPRPAFESFFHAGSLEFDRAVVERVRAVAARVPTVVDVHLDRPAVLTPLVGLGVSLVVDFGASTAAVADALTGVEPASGRLPFDIPRSMRAVRESRPDAAFDTADPLFRYGDGLPL